MTKGDQIRAMLEEGKPYSEIGRATGAASSTISYHAKNLGLAKFTFARKLHDWTKIQDYYDEGHTLRQLKEKFGVDPSVIRDAEARGLFDKRTFCPVRKQLLRSTLATSMRQNEILSEDMFKENSSASRSSVKRRVLRDMILSHACSGDCPLNGIVDPVWAGQPVILHLDHKNGVSNDNRIANLRMLCPNCHSQTSTYCGRNNAVNVT